MYALDDPDGMDTHALTKETVYEVAMVARNSDAPADATTPARQKELIVKALEARQRRNNLACFILGMLGLVGSILEAELLFANNDEPTSAVNIIKAVVTATTAALIIMLIVRTVNLLTLYKIRGGVDEDETLVTSGMLHTLATEVLVCIVHAPPGVHFEIETAGIDGTVTYSFDALCTMWQLARLYLFIAVMNDLVGFRTAQARVIAKWNNVSFNAAFTFKALMERAPLRLLGFVMLSLIFVLGYCIRVLERPLCKSWGPPPPSLCDERSTRTDPNSLGNLFWFVIITMTTVGYGDMFPLTHGARAVAVITCLVGVAVIALLVTVITSMSTFAPDEMRAFNALYRNTGRKVFQDAAARVLQACWVYSRGQLYAARIKAGDSPVMAARNIQRQAPGSERRSSVVGDAVRRLSQTVQGSKYSLANGNLHIRHRKRFGKQRLLRQLRTWKWRKQQFLALTKEKSEVAMVVKEILDVRGRLNEMTEQQAMHTELMETTHKRMARIEKMLESVSMHLNIPVPKVKHLEPLVHPSGSPPPRVGSMDEVKATAGAGAGAGELDSGGLPRPSQRGGIQWQWSESNRRGVAAAETKLAPLGALEDDDTLLEDALPGGLDLPAGGLSIPKNAVVPAGSLGALGSLNLAHASPST